MRNSVRYQETEYYKQTLSCEKKSETKNVPRKEQKNVLQTV